MFNQFKITISKVAALIIIVAATFTFNGDSDKLVAYGIAAGMLGAKQLIERTKDDK